MTTPAKGDEAPKSQVPNTQSTKPVAAAATTIPDPDAKKPEPKEEPTPELTKEEPASELTKEEPASELTKAEEKKLEAILGDESEADDEDDAPTPASASHPMVAVAAKLRKLVSSIPQETPDEFQIWGAAGIVLNLGDLRTIVKQLR